jgi:hypothetical protein
LFRELRRRQVFKVGVAYTLAAWGLVQLTDTVGPDLKLAEGTVLTVFIVAVIGFPIVIVLTWLYDLTPQGFKATSRALVGHAPDPETEPGAAVSAQSALAAVAVLPFGKLTPASQYAYLADALPIELQSLLSRMP